MGKSAPIRPRTLNRFAIVLDTLMATHNLSEVALLKFIGKRRNEQTIKMIRSWRTGICRPRAGKYLILLEKLEAKLEIPVGRFANLSGGRASTFYKAIKKQGEIRKQLLRWHIPADFDFRPESERKEIMEWISANVMPCSTAYGKYQSKTARSKFAVVFPSLPPALGGRPWMGDRLKNRASRRKFIQNGTVRASLRLTKEMAQLVAFHTAPLPPKGFRRRKRWSRSTARMQVGRYGGVLGALSASPDRHVRGLGVPPDHLTMALFIFPNIWEWYLNWSLKRRGFYSSSDQWVIYDVKHLTRKYTGWIRQHPKLGRKLKPVDGLITQKDIDRARANWGAACDQAYEYSASRLLELRDVTRKHRDPFLPILTVLTNDSPLREYKKIGDEIIRQVPDERRVDDKRRLLEGSTAARNYLMLRFALHLGLRQRNLRELLFSAPGTKHRDTTVLEELERGELRWNATKKVWHIFIPAIGIKNGGSEFFRGRPFEADLPNLEGLYNWINSYLSEHRERLLNGCTDPETFFVRSMRETGCDPAMDVTSYYSAWKMMIQKHGIYNPYTKRGAIEGLLPHGPHAVRDVLATHLLKTTGSYELASFAIQDSMASVMKHYTRFMPHEKIARAAEELNKVWRD